MSIYLSNLQKDPDDPRDFIFGSPTWGLPKQVDLRKYARDIEDQLWTSSCTANAGVSAVEILAERAGKFQDFSRLFLYYNLRKPHAHLSGRDVGAFTRDICKSLNKQGVCLESTWSFIPARVNETPPESAYKEAEQYKVGRYERIPTPLPDWQLVKAALAQGFPVIVGMRIREPFFNVPRTFEQQLQHLTVQNYSTQAQAGGHAMVIVGYDDVKRYWIVENSWGAAWGEGGYVAFPYDTFAFNNDVLDLWVVREFAGYQTPSKWQPVEPPPLTLSASKQVIEIQQPDATTSTVVSEPLVLDSTGGHLPKRFIANIINPPAVGLRILNRSSNAPSFMVDFNAAPNGFDREVLVQVLDSSIVPVEQSRTIRVVAKPYIVPSVQPEPEPVVEVIEYPVVPEEPVVEPEPEPTPKPEKKEKSNSNKILIVAVLLIAGLILGKYLGVL